LDSAGLGPKQAVGLGDRVLKLHQCGIGNVIDFDLKLAIAGYAQLFV
jgi:hypothetical protein